ncbi:hypothetical protein QLX08_004440 [Tetragonisca angustula]|uniref:Uncharacterized protein n=1 Tax=Tetragonisca angustula TaxID=166442 RepID=A0AAW1A4H4_9HYME
MLHSTYLISVGVLFLFKSVSAKHSRNYNKFCSSIEDKSLSSRESDNLRQLLNFIRRSPDFRPLTFSVILPEFQSSFVELLLRHVGENSIETYKIRARDLSVKILWMKRLQLTWILVVRDLSSLDVFIYWQPNLWKVGNQYLIIFTGKAATALWQQVFRNLWRRYNVYRVIVIDDFQCLTRYAPFEASDDGFGRAYRSCLKTNPTKRSEKDDSLQNSLEDQTGCSDIDQLNADTRLFEDFRNLNGYPVKVLVFESLLMNVSYDDQNRLKLSKSDANVVFALEEAMRAKFRVKAMRWIDFKDDPFRTSLDGIEAGKYDMIVTGFFIKIYERYQKFQFTCPMYEDKLCFVSPDSGLVPKAYMPFLPFQKSLWFLLMAYNVVVTFLWCLVEYISESLRRPRSNSRRSSINRSTRNQTRGFKNWMGNRFGTRDLHDLREPPEIPRYIERLFIFMEYLCYPLQTSKSPAQRALLIGTLFFGLIVNGLYQSVLVSSLSKPFHYPQLHTLKDVVDSGKMVVTKYANLKNVFLDDSELFRKIHVINTQRSTWDIVAHDDKIAITRYYAMKLENLEDYYDKEGNSLLNLVDECSLNYRVSYVTRLHSPYAERVDFLLLRLREAGLLNLWFGNMLYEIKTSKMRRKTLDSEKRRIRLSLEYYSLTLLLLFVGLVGSVLIFIAELYVAKRCICKKKYVRTRKKDEKVSSFE